MDAYTAFIYPSYGAHRGVYSRARHLHRVSEDGGGGVTKGRWWQERGESPTAKGVVCA